MDRIHGSDLEIGRWSGRIRRGRRVGFTLVEVLVVVGIIALLIALLLPALGSARTSARKAATSALMKSLGDASDSFALAINRYPGALSERELNTANRWDELSGTENALLDLMGGLQPFGTESFKLADLDIYRRDIGRGPMVNGKKYGAFFVPKPDDLYFVNGQGGQARVDDQNSPGDTRAFPDLVDQWGAPIIFWRNSGQKSSGLGRIGNTPAEDVLVAFDSEPDKSAAFYWASFQSYTASAALTIGRGGNRVDQQQGMLYDGNGLCPELSQALVEQKTLHGTPRGGYVIMSAGPDTIYFNEAQYPTNPSPNMADDIEAFDDIVHYGGS